MPLEEDDEKGQKTVRKSVRADEVAYLSRVANEVQMVDEDGNTRLV